MLLSSVYRKCISHRRMLKACFRREGLGVRTGGCGQSDLPASAGFSKSSVSKTQCAKVPLFWGGIS